ncbi:MAG: amino acid adenylation domain-containing protein, partial [Bacteroidota bacterium]
MVFPASFGQKRLWFLDQFEPGSPYYNIPAPFRVRGAFDLAVFQRTVNEILRRHESLRTTFIAMDGQPMQVISEVQPVSLPVVDLSQWEPEKREEEIITRARRDARTPFDLATGPLFRVTVLKAGPEDHVVLFTMHHIISDGWSIGILVREIGEIYGAFLRGLPSPLPDLPIQYADYAEWQREWFQGEVLDSQLLYWQSQVTGAPELLELPTDRPRLAVYSNIGSTESISLSRELSDGVHKVAREQGVTPFMVLLAAFQTLLHRYSGQDDICIGTPIANRTQAEVEHVIGLFINTLVLRTRFAGDPTVKDLLKQVREVTLGAFARQDLPFEMLLDALHLDRDMSHPPLFQVMFILQNTPASLQEFPGMRLEQIDVDMGTATYDMTLSVAESRSGYAASMEFNTDLFDGSTIRRLLAHYRRILEAIVGDVARRVSAIRFLSDDEHRHMVFEWNNVLGLRPDKCVHTLVEETAKRTPGATAATFSGMSLSYRDLNAQANRVAHHLLRRGVGTESKVGLCLEKSLNFVVGMLGVLKAGGAYVPFDPANPPERLASMMEDSEVAILLTVSEILAGLPQFNGEVICLDTDKDLREEREDDPVVTVHPDNLAYMIYTSGTTGKSKGTMVSHRSLVNSYLGWEESYTLKTLARSHLQMANVSFDVFSGDFVRALCSGGKLVLCPREYLLDAPRLYQLMKREEVTIAEFVPAVLRNLALYLRESGQDLSFMNVVIAGSDIWYVSEYKEFLSLLGPQTRLINSFGLTEAAIDSSLFEAATLNLPLERLVPIGRPFPNTQIYIFDPRLEPVPIGITGEVYVGGLGLARGYHRRADLTADKFLPHPYSSKGGERIYRTGDLGRFLPDGNIEFLGRMDHQVKIRGFRVELGEIETALTSHPAVKEGVVIVREDTPGDKRIIAYVVTCDTGDVSNADLRKYLLEKVPDYMVPAAVVRLESMPLTPNGKVDRKALPQPEYHDADAGVAFEPPSTPTQEKIASIWKQVLNIDRVGIHDNFFLLGGHSLLATQLVSRLRSSFHREIPLRKVFESPTVAGLAEAIDELAGARGELAMPPIVRAVRDENLPLSYAQQRLWFLDQLEPDSPLYNIPEVYRVQGMLDVAVLDRCFNEVVRRHETLRTAIVTVDGKPRLEIADELKLSVSVGMMPDLSESERNQACLEFAEEAARRPIPLCEAPLLRVNIVRFEADDHVIVLVIHHIISDEWSTDVFMREVATLYDAFSRGLASPLPELALQYADFAAWQRNWLQGEVLAAEMKYWTEQLGGSHLVLELPTDRPRPTEQTINGSYTTFWLSQEASQALRALSAHEGATIFMTVLAAFQTFLCRYTGQTDIAIGTPIANRSRRETEGLIGFFVNTLVMRTDLAGDPGFREVLRRVREVALGAYAHQDVPFEKLVDVLEPQRDLSHSPLFQVMLVVQNARTNGHESTALTINPVEAHSGTAKFDLTLFMVEGPERIGGALEYNTDLFDKETAERMVRHFGCLVEDIIANPDKEISCLTMVPAEELHRLLMDWSGGTNAAGPLSPIDALLREQAARTPDEVAIASREGHLSYQDLEERVDLLAEYLNSLGVVPEVRVGIGLDRSMEMMMAILAVLRAGGVYVPLDRTYPEERLTYIVEDSGIEVLLRREGTMQCKLPETVRVVDLEREWPTIRNCPPRRKTELIEANNLAYVLYTSGSTGKPKGTMVTHQGLANYLHWCLSTYHFENGSGTLVHSTIAFDATVTALFPPLLCGRTVRLLQETDDIDELARELRAQRGYSVLKITPAHLELLRHQLPENELPSITNALVIGGENLTYEQIHLWRKHAPATEIYNEYGPTESVVGCIVHRVQGEDSTGGSVPIGRPIPNTRAYILDNRMLPAPTGVAGELYLGGIGVARGYVRRSDLTAERFLPDPFSGEIGGRLYRTGDLVRYRGDGTMEFLGRIDDQVKIRGFRVETGEIESCLNRHQAIKEAVVMARQDSPGEKRLVAYIVSLWESHPTVAELRGYLKGHLPEYMIPSAFVFLDAIPLTPNGKVDKRSLPAPDGERPALDVEYIPPATGKEQALADIWTAVLGTSRVGANDNFFELGGDSILSIQVVARAQQAGMRISARQIFQFPTLRVLADAAEEGVTSEADQGSVTGDVPLTPIQQWFFEQDVVEVNHWNQSLLFEVKEEVSAAEVEAVVRSLLEHHDALRMRFRRGAAGWTQWNAGVEEAVPVTEVDL